MRRLAEWTAWFENRQAKTQSQTRRRTRVLLLMIMIGAFAALTCVGASASRAEAADDDFALRDDDIVVFLGDSITAGRTYGKVVENFTLLRFPERSIRFINAGKGGDTAEGGLKRLERDVFGRGATVLTVAYGINDIGWGVWADDEHKKRYLDAIRGIVDACKARDVRVYVCSAAITAQDPDKAETGFLTKLCDEGMALAKSLGAAGVIDVQREMRAVQRRVLEFNARNQGNPTFKHESLHVADGVHLNELGQLAMAYAILKGLRAPADVSAATLDAQPLRAVSSQKCKVSGLQGDAEGVEFDRLDDGLPINFGLFGALNYRFVPIPEELNRYLIQVVHLKPGRYDIFADGRKLGTFDQEQLSQGVNISSSTPDAWEPGGPWDVQASVLQSLTDARHNLVISQVYARTYQPDSAERRQVEEHAKRVNEEIERLQRNAAKPKPYHFAIRKTIAPPSAPSPSLSGDAANQNKENPSR